MYSSSIQTKTVACKLRTTTKISSNSWILLHSEIGKLDFLLKHCSNHYKFANKPPKRCNYASFGMFCSHIAVIFWSKSQHENIQFFPPFWDYISMRLLKITESIYDSHYCSLGRSFHHGVSGRTKECGWLRQSSFVQSWSTGPAVGPVSLKVTMCIPTSSPIPPLFNPFINSPSNAILTSVWNISCVWLKLLC